MDLVKTLVAIFYFRDKTHLKLAHYSKNQNNVAFVEEEQNENETNDSPIEVV